MPEGRVYAVDTPPEMLEIIQRRAQSRREMAAVGLRWRETRRFLPSQHFIVFEKP